MSAAEKLRALVIEDERIGSEIGSNARKKFRSQNWPLPQIAALVEAAERVDARKDEEARRFRPARMRDLRAALAALEEALT